MDPIKPKDDLLKLSKQLVKDLDKLLETGNWEESLFLRTMSKRLNSIRDEAQELEESLIKSGTAPIIEKSPVYQLKEGYIKVYILLYQVDGNNLSIWQNMLKSLTKYSVNRPIYTSEEHVQAVVRSKPDPIRHAYVIVAVKKDEVISSETQKLDSQGHNLFILKEKAIDAKNIISFVHANKKIYNFQNNKLHLQSDIA
jgi:Dot/Icm secretion system protein IcmQ